jgi:ribosomal protein S2
MKTYSFDKGAQIARVAKKIPAVKIKSKSELTIGQTLTLTISSEAPNSLGILKFSGGMTILVPKTELGDCVKVKIVKIHKKIAFAAVIEIIEKQQKKVPVSVGTTINVKVISSKESVAVAKLSSSDEKQIGTAPYFIIIPQEKAKIGDNLEVIVTRIKTNYGFAKTVRNIVPLGNILSNTTTSLSQTTGRAQSGLRFSPEVPFSAPELHKFSRDSQSPVHKMNIILPKKTKFFGGLAAASIRMQMGNTSQSIILFIAGLRPVGSTGSSFSTNRKFSMGAQLGENVRIKVSKVFQSGSGIAYAFAKVIKINPISIDKKQLQIKQNIEEMLKSGMHFGEKAVKCQAKMREYIWIRKKGRNKNRPFIKKGRHFLNLLKTRRCLNKVSAALTKYAVKGRTFLFVGTKKPAASLISRAALFSKKSFFVNTRWLGGMLTNWKTILKSISKIRPILKEKQRIIQMILTKRQGIKLRLMKKILTSMKYIQKGRQFLDTIKTNPNVLILRNNAFIAKKKELIQKGQQLLSKRQQLLEKRKELFKQSKLLKEKGFQIVNKYQRTLTQLINQRQKLKELRNQALLCREIQKMKKNEALLDTSKEASKISGELSSEIRNEAGLRNTKQTENSRLVVLSKLLNKLGGFTPYIKTSMKAIYENINELLILLSQQKEALKEIQTQMTMFINIKKKLLVELRKIKTKLVSEQKVIKLLKSKIKRSSAEKRFLKFLPKCKHQAPLATDATNSVQILMQKFVDPKIKQATTSLQIYDDKLRTKSKKIAAARKKKWLQLEKYFGGVANMLKMNKNKISKNVAIIIGQQEEMNAVRECQKLGIQMFHVVDTNCNPTLANHYVPANDDSRHSIKYILTKFLKHIRLAQKLRLRLWKSTLSSAVKNKVPAGRSSGEGSRKSRMKNFR